MVQLSTISGEESKTFIQVTKDLLNGMFHRQLQCAVCKLKVLFNLVKVGQVEGTLLTPILKANSTLLVSSNGSTVTVNFQAG